MMRVKIRSMDGGVATRAPATAQPHLVRVIFLADENPPRRGLLLGVALEAKVVVAFDEHLRVDRAMRAVADRATLAQCFVFEYKRPRLITMTLSA